MRFFVLLFIIVPALEIGLFILAGNTIGAWPTVLLIIVTGFLGAYLARKQGIKALYQVQDQLLSGQPPGIALLDGVCILLGGILLLSPGFITDVTGLLLLLPITRKLVRPYLLKLIKKWINRKQIYIYR
ncbi:FxsA family protein [Bacillus niameyensis]|uniref:FxsA family protein n=1 Tax=Bacillus niameyensis TaxID=1522308 RepID=UPI0007829A1B|nr:FxsA family protein [Bacillus niameyensis]